MSQTAVTNEPAQAYEGKLHTGISESQIMSRLASEIIYFGKGVVPYDDDEIVVGDQRVILPAATGDPAKFLGVAIADPSLERLRDPTDPAVAAPYGAYVQYQAVQVLRKGQIWVVSEDAVDDLTKGVWMRFQNESATPPTEQLGSFRATTEGDYEEIAAGAKWLAGATIGSVEFGLLEVNLPI